MNSESDSLVRKKEAGGIDSALEKHSHLKTSDVLGKDVQGGLILWGEYFAEGILVTLKTAVEI